jgi:archaellum component FlaC
VDESRFDRLEQKIDKLTDAVTKIVRVEEQMASNNRRLDAIETRLNKHSEDINKVAELARNNERTAKVADKLFWLVAASIISTAFYFLR